MPKVKSALSQDIDNQLNEIEAKKTKRMSLGEKVIFVLCCVYCRPPEVTPEETPEERERREKIEQLLEQREVEMKRLEKEALAAKVKTVMYCKNAVFVPSSPPSPVPVKETSPQEEEEKEDKADGESEGDDEKEGKEECEGEGEGEGEGDNTPKVVPGQTSVVIKVDASSPKSISSESSTPSTVDPTEYLYANAHNHNYYTAFGDSSQTSPMILISEHHTHASAASSYCDALFGYVSALSAKKDVMRSAALAIQCAQKTCIAWRRVRQRTVEQANERR